MRGGWAVVLETAGLEPGILPFTDARKCSSSATRSWRLRDRVGSLGWAPCIAPASSENRYQREWLTPWNKQSSSVARLFRRNPFESQPAALPQGKYAYLYLHHLLGISSLIQALNPSTRLLVEIALQQSRYIMINDNDFFLTGTATGISGALYTVQRKWVVLSYAINNCHCIKWIYFRLCSE